MCGKDGGNGELAIQQPWFPTHIRLHLSLADNDKLV
jgi:hypothetical protein